MHVLFIISSLACGGAERVMSIMANYWVARGWKVTIITLDIRKKDFYSLHANVDRVSLDLVKTSPNFLHAIIKNYQSIKILRYNIRKIMPSVIISFVDLANILTILSTIGLKIPVIVSERTDPRFHKIGKAWDILRRFFYPLAHAVVAQTAQVQEWLQNFVPKEKVLEIPNPIILIPSDSFHKKIFVRSTYKVIAVGRLESEKCFDILLYAFELCAGQFPQWSLVILGEGRERKSLELLAKELGIDDRLDFYGQVEEPMDMLPHADLFVLSSKYEGFPNTLLEAMACGLPVISTDCPSGPRSIIRHGIDGLLVPQENVKGLAEAMALLMANENLRNRLASRSREVLTRFGIKNVMGMWELLICKCISTCGK